MKRCYGTKEGRGGGRRGERKKRDYENQEMKEGDGNREKGSKWNTRKGRREMSGKTVSSEG